MSFDRKFYEAAEQEMTNRRNRSDRLLESAELELKTKHPEIYKLSRELKNTSAKILRLISGEKLEKEEFERRFEEIENENLTIQDKMRNALVKKGYPADYLDLKHTCNICKDTGVINGSHCTCFMEVVRRLASEEINRGTPMELCDFRDFSLHYYDDTLPLQGYGVTARTIMAENLDYCRRYAENFHLPADNMGIFMRGGTGLGKTHLSLSIAKLVIAKGYNVIYGSAPDLLRKAEREQFRNEDGNTLERLIEADLLIMDDLGAEFENKFSVSAVYNIVNNRLNAGRPLIVSTNLEYSDLLARYGDRIISRLGTLNDLPFVGKDVRFLKRNEKR